MKVQPRLLYLARISFKVDGKLKSFTDKPKMREYSPPKPVYNNVKETYRQEPQEKEKTYKNNFEECQ